MSRRATARLALGTVQFGLPYGLMQQAQPPMSRQEATSVLAAAWRGGIDTLDTGAAYGNAEAVIGELRPRDARFDVISKTPPVRRSEVTAADVEGIIAGAHRSLAKLRVEALAALLVHHAPDLLVPGGTALFGALEKLRSQGAVRRLGVSVYDAATLRAVLAQFPVEIVQLPLNLLDQRFVQDGTLEELARRGIEVHARSVFLQGVLLTDGAKLPAHFAPVRGRIDRFQAECAAAAVPRAAAALGFAAGCAGVSRIVIGVNSAAQLEENLAAFSAASTAQWTPAPEGYAVDDPEIIDPRKWAA